MSRKRKKEKPGNRNNNRETLLLIGGGFNKKEMEILRSKVNSLGKCCEGGEEGWTG